MAALFLLLQNTQNLKSAFFFAWLFGLGKFGVGVSWLFVVIKEYGGVHDVVAVVLVLLFVAGIALLTGLFGVVFRYLLGSTIREPTLNHKFLSCFYFAVAWFGYEWLRSSLLTGFPILDIGHIVLDTPMQAVVSVVGTHATGFLIALISAALVSGWVLLGFAVCVLLLATAINAFQFVERGESRTLGLVQVNIPLKEKWYSARSGQTFQIYGALTESMPPKDLVLWSEAAFATSAEYMVEALHGLQQRTNHDSIATGLIEQADSATFNSLILVDNDQHQLYRKHRLVPFGEYVPFDSALRGLIQFFDIPYSALDADTSNRRSLHTDRLKLAPAICYEASFESDVADAVSQSEADAIVVVSEDAWFGDSLAPHQNFEMVRMRALEHGRYVIRTANSGISGVIAPDGRVVAQANQFERTTLEAEISTMKGSTPYTRYGPLPFSVVLNTLLLLLLLKRRFYRKQSDF